MIRSIFLAAALGAAGLSAAVCAQAAPAHDNACVFARSISDFEPLDRNKLVIWSPGRRNAYLVELTMPFTDLRFANELAVIDRDRNGQLCGYGMDRIVVGSHPREVSTVMSVTRLDDAAIAALEQQYGMTLTRKKSGEAGTGPAHDASQGAQAQPESDGQR
jgi:hypothetical protein